MLQRLRARAQPTIYEAGTSFWSSEGKVTTVPRVSLEPFCAHSSLPNSSGAAYVLNSSKDIVSLKFNGTGIAVYGITFARDSCEAGNNPTLVTLDVGAPGLPTNTATSTSATATTPGDPQPTCDSFPTPVAACNRLLARWVGLDSRNRYSLSVSTSGQQIVVLNAQVFLEPDVASTFLPTATPPPLGPGLTPGLPATPPSLPPAGLSPITNSTMTATTPDSPPPGYTDDMSPPSSKTSSSANANAPTDPSTLLSGPHAHAERTILPAVLVPLAALAFILGFLYVRWRKRRRQALSNPQPPKPEPPDEDAAQTPPEISQWTSSASLGNASQPDPYLALKHRDVKMLFRPPADAPRADDASSLRQAIEDAGLRTEDVVVSLNRLREQTQGGQSDRRAPRPSSPPHYDD